MRRSQKTCGSFDGCPSFPRERERGINKTHVYAIYRIPYFESPVGVHRCGDRKKLAEASMAVHPSRESGKEESIKRTYMPFTGFRTLKAQLVSTDAEIAALKRERETIRRNIGAYQAKVDLAPRRDQG